jgi:hypothetical protein
MLNLIAATIIATTPQLTITLAEPSDILCVTVEYVSQDGVVRWPAQPITFMSEFPDQLTGPGAYRIYVDSATMPAVGSDSGLFWNPQPRGFRTLVSLLGPIPTDATKTRKVTFWPRKEITPPGNWIARDLPAYIQGREANGWTYVGHEYFAPNKKIKFEWEVEE